MKPTVHLLQLAAVALALALSLGDATAQQSLREKLIGTWTFVVAEVTAPDGKKSFPFGETPKGILVFTTDGHFSQIHIASDVPKIASNNRLNGTAEEYAAIMRRSTSCRSRSCSGLSSSGRPRWSFGATSRWPLLYGKRFSTTTDSAER